MSKVFISYSHKDEAWKKKLLPHLKALEQAGVDMVVWEDRQIDAGAEWHPAIEQAMSDAAVAILLISADYLASSFCVKQEVPYLIDCQEKKKKKGMLLIPVLIQQCPWEEHRWLASRQMLPRDGKCVALNFKGARANIVFKDVASRVSNHFKKLVAQPESAAALPKAVHRLATTRKRRAPAKAEPQPVSKWPLLPPGRVDLTRLPETGAALFGRDEELKLLDQVSSSGEIPGQAQTRVLAFVADGGVGKSTLVNHWLREMQRDQFHGATRVFGWSFYSQGAREEGMASAETFIDAALRFFGDPDMAKSTASSWDKGERLAHMVGAERSLLVLDGMEPLQSGHAIDKGKIRDPALESLLRGLTRHSAGLCLITTREPLPELAGRPGVTARDLNKITPQAGRALLRIAHVVGSDAELETLAERFGPHALAVSLLGVYLHEQPGHGIGPAKSLECLPGKEPVNRVLAGFEQWLGNGPELDVLRMLGFFDRPADAGCLHALRDRPAIPGLTDHVVELKESDWGRVLDRLKRLRLIHVRQCASGKRLVDAHPLIREHFGQQLQENDPDAWRTGHRRLYEHLCATTKEGDQPTLEDLQPLYQAVAHGCQAGMQQKVYLEVYKPRLVREKEYYSPNKIGAYGSDLGAVACFFKALWSSVSPSLAEADQAWLLNEAAHCHRALGKLPKALDLAKESVTVALHSKDWNIAAICARGLSEVELTLGKVTTAVLNAEYSVRFADNDPSNDAFFQRVNCRARLADALHQVGRHADAKKPFDEARDIQAKAKDLDDSGFSTVNGFQYCDLLLSEAERAAWKVIQKIGVRSQNW